MMLLQPPLCCLVSFETSSSLATIKIANNAALIHISDSAALFHVAEETFKPIQTTASAASGRRIHLSWATD